MNKPLKFVAACRLPTEWGVFTLHGFEEVRSGQEHVALGLPVDARDFTLAKHIFDHLGVRSVKLLTNNPQKVQVLADAGINVAEHVPLHVGENPENERYLHTKAEKLGHWFDI